MLSISKVFGGTLDGLGSSFLSVFQTPLGFEVHLKCSKICVSQRR